jgi:hypothetical protein
VLGECCCDSVSKSHDLRAAPAESHLTDVPGEECSEPADGVRGERSSMGVPSFWRCIDVRGWTLQDPSQWTPRDIALSAWVVFVVGVPSGVRQPQFRLLAAVASGFGRRSADLLATPHSTATVVYMYTRPTNGECLHRGSKQQAVRVLGFL